MTHLITLPDDVFSNIQKEYPGIPELKAIINFIFQSILQKAIEDGSCVIWGFGNFHTYKAYSGKSQKLVPRFKFKISRSLDKRIKSDPFIMEAIQKITTQIVNEKMIREKHDLSEENKKSRNIISNNQSLIRERTKEKMVNDEISRILEKDINSEDQKKKNSKRGRKKKKEET